MSFKKMKLVNPDIFSSDKSRDYYNIQKYQTDTSILRMNDLDKEIQSILNSSSN